MAENLSGPFQENLLTLICFDEEYAPLIKNSVPLEYYEFTLHPIAKKAYQYIDRFGEPPKEHISDLLEPELKEDKDHTLENLLLQLHQTQSSVNPKYIVGRLRTFLEDQDLRSAIVKAADELMDSTDDNKEAALAKAKTILNEAGSHSLELFDPGHKLEDVDEVYEWMEHRYDDFKLGIPSLDKRSATPMRGGLFLFLAPPKSGKCVAGDTLIVLPDGKQKKIKDVVKDKDPKIITYDLNSGRIKPTYVTDYINNGKKEVFQIRTRTGREIKCTLNHPFLTGGGWANLEDLSIGEKIAVSRNNHEFYKDATSDILWDEILSIEKVGMKTTYDLTVPETNCFIANDMVVHNSQCMVHIGRSAMLQGHTVLYITLEMPAEQIMQRYYQSLFGVTKHDDPMSIPVMVKDKDIQDNETENLIDIEYDRVIPSMTFANEESREWVRDKIKRMGKRDNILFKQFAPNSLDINGLNGYLDDLEKVHHFTPDIVVLDYADDMRLNNDNYRLDLKKLMKDLRAIAVDRNCAMVTASQVNREGSKKRYVTGSDVSEDYSKIFTADVVVSYNQTDVEHELGLARLWVPHGRDDYDRFGCVITQNYAVSQFCLDSVLLTKSSSALLEELEKQEDSDKGGNAHGHF